MGKLSLECVVNNIDRAIQSHQLRARQQIFELVRRAKTEDPAFFDIPFNPFTDNSESEDDEEDELDEEERSLRWFSSLKASPSKTAREILKVRKGLYRAVQGSLDELKATSAAASTSPSFTTITPTALFASLYCRLLQMENII